jgi:hypothetical protein
MIMTPSKTEGQRPNELFLNKGNKTPLTFRFSTYIMEEAAGEAIRKEAIYRVTGATSIGEKGQPPLLGGWPSS